MGKNRKSVFDSMTTSMDIESAAKKVQKESVDNIPNRSVKEPMVDSANGGKLMHLYVNRSHHKQAKVNASMRDLKLGEYIEWLIGEDVKNLK